jgi:hydrogenase-4 component E
MNATSYGTLLNLAVGALLLTGVVIVWRRELLAMTRLLAWQGAALAAIAIVEGVREHHPGLVGVGGAVLVLRGGLLPWLLARAVGAEAVDRRESTPLLNTTASLLAAAALTVTAFAVSRPLVELDPTNPAARAAPAAFAVVLMAVLVMISRRRALSQAVGFLMLDNGITAAAFLTTAGVPLIVEFGASLDVLFAVVIFSALTGRLRHAFGDTDVEQLRQLHE